MSKTEIVGVAIAIYLFIGVAGGAAYYVISQQPAPEPAAVQQQKKPAAPEPTAEELAAKAAREAEEKKAAELRQQRDKEIAQLTSTMRETVRGDVTVYSYQAEEHPSPGLYLRPSLVVGKSSCAMQYELFYYYTIHDALDTAWIYGDHLQISAAARNFDLAFDPAKRQKKVASDAEWLWERYTGRTDQQFAEAYRTIARSGSALITYYQQGGKSRTQRLREDEVQQIHDIVALHDLYQAKFKDEQGAE